MNGAIDVGRLARLTSVRRLRDRPLRTALTAAGVASGVALLFSILLLNAELAASVRATGAPVTGPRLLEVSAAGPGGLPATLADDLAADPRVEVAAPLLVDRTTISAGGRRAGVFVVGATPDIADAAPDIRRDVEFELADDPAAGLALSRGLASRLGVEAGGRVRVETPTEVAEVPVVAVVASPLLTRVNGGMAAVMQLSDAQRLFGHAGRVDQVIVAARRGTDVGALRADLARRLSGTATVGRPGATTGAASADLDAYLLGTQASALIALIVAAVLVFNTMTMAMAEQRTEIALARSLGATRRQLLAAALSEAALVGAVGTVIGLVAGGVLARSVLPYVNRAYGAVSPVDTPTSVHLRLVPLVVTATAGLVTAVVGAALPARRAARANPVDALRPAATYEWRDPSARSRTLVVALGGGVLFVIGTALSFAIQSSADIDLMTAAAILALFLGVTILLPTAVPLAANALAAALGRVSPATGRLAGDALRANPRRTSFTVVALALPLATLIAIGAAFGAGLSKFDRVAHTYITAPLDVTANSFSGGYTASQPLAASTEAVLRDVPGVRTVLADQNAFIALPDDSQGVLFAVPLRAAARAGVPDFVRDDDLSDDPGAFRRGLSSGQIAVSKLAARNLQLHAGGRVTLPTPSGPHTFTVAAVYEDWSMRSTFYLDRDTYTALWADDGVARFRIVPERGVPVPALRSRLEAAVASAGLAAQVRTRDEDIRELLGGLTNLIGLTRAIELATLLCAAGAMANTAFTAVAERRWTFGLQRALGMTRKQLTRSLALEALAIGVIGSVAGAFIGLGLGAVLTHAMSAISSSRLGHPIPWPSLTASLVLGAAIAALATQYPRRTARRLTIIESLRFE